MARQREQAARQINDTSHLRYVHAWHALLHVCRGEWRAAERVLDQARGFNRRGKVADALAFVQLVDGYLAWQRGDLTSAERLLGAAVETFRDGHPAEYALGVGLHGLAIAETGDLDGAERRQAELETLVASRLANTLATGTLVSCLALMALLAGDDERATRHYQSLLAFRGQHHWFLIDRVLALVATRVGEYAAAAAHLDAAEALARREGYHPELARTLDARVVLEQAISGAGSDGRVRQARRETTDLRRSLAMPATPTPSEVVAPAPPTRQTDYLQPGMSNGLTEREVDVLRFVATGMSNRDIARALCLSEKTVANHLTSIFTKTGSSNRAGATAFAMRHGLA
jgi:DNA-binding NarL/FixJ family response regulator